VIDPCSKPCSLKEKRAIHCFNEEKGNLDKGMERIKDRRNGNEGCKYEGNYSPLKFSVLFELFLLTWKVQGRSYSSLQT
jgi:hypothetical protein